MPLVAVSILDVLIVTERCWDAPLAWLLRTVSGGAKLEMLDTSGIVYGVDLLTELGRLECVTWTLLGIGVGTRGRWDFS